MKKIFSLFLACTMVTSLMAWDHMYIVGDATPGGWDLNNLTEMNYISDAEFEWTGWLNPGDVKFITGNDWGCTQYGADDFDKSLTRNTVFTATQLGEDKKFKLTEETKGWYTLHINTAEMKISTYPRYIYPVGGGCEAVWDLNYNNATLTETGLGTGIYTGTVELKHNDEQNPELKFNCARDWSVFVGPEEDWDGAHDISGVGTYKAKMYTSDDHKFWVLDAGFGTYHVSLDLNNNKLYLVPEQVTFKMHASEAAKIAMDNDVSFYWWNDLGSGEWSVSESDGWYTAIVTNAYMPINYLWHGKDWNSKTGDQKNFDQGFVQNTTVIAAYNGKIIDTDKRQIEVWYEDTYNSYGTLTLTASEEHVVPGTEVTFTATVADFAGTPEYIYYINGVETSLTNSKYTFTSQGFYRVDAVTTIDHQILKDSKEIFVGSTLTFKVHATDLLKATWGDLYFYSWQFYDGYDHASCVKLENEQEGFYSVEIEAVAPVKFLLKNRTLNDWSGLQSVDMNNDEAGYTTGVCVEIGSSTNGEGKYLVSLVPTCTLSTFTQSLNGDGFASVYMPYNFTLPVGVEAYKGVLSGSEIVLTKVNQEVLPQETGLILYSESISNADITLTESVEGAAVVENNSFTGTLDAKGETNVYVLGQTSEAHSTAFYYLSEVTIPANRAYLKTGGSGAPLRIRFATEVTTGMENANENANVNKVIRDGRVYIVRDGRIYNIMGQIEK